jgi:hypothetical protein
LWTYQDLIKKRYGYAPFAWGAHRMLDDLAAKHTQAGFLGQNSDLNLSMSEFVRQHHLDAASDCVRSFLTGCGYGYYDETPALYLMKLAPIVLRDLIASGLMLGLHHSWSIFEHGWQELCRRMAADINVKLSSTISQINRHQHKIELRINGVPDQFDCIILTVPVDEILTVLDCRPNERSLFQKVRYLRYLVTLVEGEGLFTASFVDNIAANSLGHVNFVVQPHHDVPVFLIYQQLSETMSFDEAMAFARQDVQLVQGKIKKVIRHKEWRYFPHVSTEDLKAGYYEALESLQGKDGIYYAGALLSFETVEHTAAYARALVRQYF